MLTQSIRAVVFVFGLLAFLAGVGAVAVGDAVDGLWTVLAGTVMMLAAVLQRPRYRPPEAERLNPASGPGGGEGGGLEPRFVPTTEVFIDPSSGHRMRVFVDPRTGERRYQAQK